jgi:Spy/CpxP family protein refolding chaperone
MHNKTKILMVVVGTLALTLAVGANLWASPLQNAAPGQGQGDKKPAREWIQSLGLSPDQVAKLRENRLEERKQMIKTRSEMETLQLDLSEEGMKDKPDMAKVEKLAQQMGQIHARMIVQRVKGVTFLRSILTPEQKQKLDQLHVQGGMGEGWGRGGMMHHGPEGKGEDPENELK